MRTPDRSGDCGEKPSADGGDKKCESQDERTARQAQGGAEDGLDRSPATRTD
ncbi:hypothetical protein [Pseudarthrobacter sp. H2]|uniref:hypothetical protein n=1 Tax=Pseudarthrobacter sp. H2 TaxID=3418415 RepID=UPI003CF72CC1